MDLLLINPGQAKSQYITEHLGILGLKSYLSVHGYTVDAVDMAVEELSIKEGIERIYDLSPQVVGVSLLDDSKHKGLDLIKRLRQSGYKGWIITGGYFATFAAQDILRDFPEVDFVVRGEGEFTLLEILNKIVRHSNIQFSSIKGISYRQNQKIMENPSRPLIEDLDILPPVDRKYAGKILEKNSPLRIYATRGCWGQCSFCDIIGLYRSSAGKVWRSRSVKNLVDEIEYLADTYNTNYFIFNDDQFLLKGKKAFDRSDAIASELEERKLNIQFELMCRADTIYPPAMSRLKSAGLKRVFLGVESFDERQLRNYRKRISVIQNLKALNTLKKLNIDVIVSVILVNAYTTFKDLLRQFIFLSELKRRYFNSPDCQISVNNKLDVYRGSAVYQEYKQKGLIKKDHYLTKIEYKLYFWTLIRLWLFDFEVHITRFFLASAEFLKNSFYYVKVWFRGVKKPKSMPGFN